MPSVIRAFLIMASILLITAQAEASGLYTITDLGTLPGTSQSTATGINDLGQVVGYANNPSDGGLGPQYNPRSFLYSNGEMTPISPIGGGAASAINNSGEVVGGSNVGINNSGQVAGPSFQVPYTSIVNGVPTTTQATFIPVGINDAGQVVGTLGKPDTVGGGTDAAIYQNGKVFDIGKVLGVGSDPTVALGINRAGDVLLYDFHGSNNTATYMLYKADGTSQVLMAGGRPNGMNDLGQLVGNTSLFPEGFIYSNGAYHPLADLLPPSSQSLWQFLDPMAINDEGEIVGAGKINGQVHAFLMTPTAAPEPSTLALMMITIGAIAIRTKMGTIGVNSVFPSDRGSRLALPAGRDKIGRGGEIVYDHPST